MKINNTPNNNKNNNKKERWLCQPNKIELKKNEQ